MNLMQYGIIEDNKKVPGWAVRRAPELIPDPLPDYLIRLSNGSVVPKSYPYLTQTMINENG